MNTLLLHPKNRHGAPTSTDSPPNGQSTLDTNGLGTTPHCTTACLGEPPPPGTPWHARRSRTRAPSPTQVPRRRACSSGRTGTWPSVRPKPPPWTAHLTPPTRALLHSSRSPLSPLPQAPPSDPPTQLLPRHLRYADDGSEP
eukprot:1831810-Rhodomonas_salina.2